MRCCRSCTVCWARTSAARCKAWGWIRKWVSTRRPARARQFGAGYLEEFRAWWADRLVLSLINRGQIKPQDFVTEASGAVSLKADARKLMFQALQAKKQEKIVHPFLGEEVEIGLLPYIQAMLLARHLRGDLAEYPPFLMR